MNKLPKYNLKFFRGFTLIELMIVIAVITILATMALYGLNKSQQAARDASRQQIMTGIQTALERYYADNQAYPTSANFCALMTTLTSGSFYMSAKPNDPGAGKPIICDTSNGTSTPVSCQSGNPYCPNNNPPNTYAQYIYVSPVDGNNCTGSATPGQSYQLALVKESGGSTSYFCSPQ